MTDKRFKDVTKTPLSLGHYEIPNLKSDISRGLLGPNAKGFDANQLVMNEKNYKEIFDKIIMRVWKVLNSQLDVAAEKGGRSR
ncbi:hypothetical protein ONS96_000548 [Cadophora gregata f. sp. sojae]|nr:hypothetical protein ONS96_000548 [Cadophora gregata f. sp. sojae]